MFVVPLPPEPLVKLKEPEPSVVVVAALVAGAPWPANQRVTVAPMTG